MYIHKKQVNKRIRCVNMTEVQPYLCFYTAQKVVCVSHRQERVPSLCVELWPKLDRHSSCTHRPVGKHISIQSFPPPPTYELSEASSFCELKHMYSTVPSIWLPTRPNQLPPCSASLRWFVPGVKAVRPVVAAALVVVAPTSHPPL